MATGVDLPMDVDEWTILPVYVALLAVQVGAIGLPIHIIDLSLTDPVTTIAGAQWSWVTVGTVGSTVVAALTYGWMERAQSWDTDQIVVVAISAGLPLAYTYIDGVASFFSGSQVWMVAYVALGAAAMVFSTTKIDEKNPILGDYL